MSRRVILLGFGPSPQVEALRERAQELAPEMEVLVTTDRETIFRRLDDIEIAAGRMPRETLVSAPRLRWMQQWGAGADWLLRTPGAVEAPFVLTNASGVHAEPIAEHIMAFVLALSRGLHRAVRAQVDGRWQRPGAAEGPGELLDSTLLLVGVGAIGERTAELAAAFGMHVVGVRRDPTVGARGVAEMHGPDELLELLPRADHVVLTVPLTAQTRHLIGERELRAMKPTAAIVNIGRGGTIDEAALVRALQEGWIAAAGLDVFEVEPLPPDSPLWRMENAIITAHYSGRTPRYEERASAIFLDNLARYVAGQPLRNVVDKSLGY